MPENTLPDAFNLNSVTKDTDRLAFDTLLSGSQQMALAKGASVFSPGDPCQHFLLVLEGSVKVFQYALSGKEIVLYRVQPGESCLLTTSCLLANEDYSVNAITETDVRAAAMPASSFLSALDDSSELRGLVFRNFSQRLSEIFTLVHELAFSSLDDRLARKLLHHGQENGKIAMTHQQIADELGSTREVISRKLKEFEQLGWILLQRGRIELTEPDAILSRVNTRKEA